MIESLKSLPQRLLQPGLAARVMRAFLTVAGLTLLGKTLSFFKDAAVAAQFGVCDPLDAFIYAFGLLATLAALWGGGMPEAFLPSYAEVRQQRGTVAAARLGMQALLMQALGLSVFAGVLYGLAPQLTGWMTRGFSTEKQLLATQMMRALLPSFVFSGLCFQLGVWLRADKRFTLVSVAPLLVPVTILLSLGLGFQHLGIQSLVWGTLVGTLLQAACLVVGLVRHLPGWAVLRPVFKREPELASVLRQTPSFLLACAIFNSALFVDQMMASWLAPGSLTLLSYADKVAGLILALTAAPSCEVLFPYFAERVAQKDWAGLRRQLFFSMRSVLLAALPAVALLIWLAPDLVRLLFQRKAFTAEDAQRVAEILRFSALQIPFYIIGSLATRVVVALKATRFILLLATCCTLANAGLNWLLMKSLGVPGIALSTAFVQMLSAALVCGYVLRKTQQAKVTSPGAV
jgi:putative peptidoglycan lipid II flippase